MAEKLHHALTRADYFLEEDNSIRVVDGDKWGRFDADGYWIEGPLRHCDPHMCRWLASGRVMREFAARTQRKS